MADREKVMLEIEKAINEADSTAAFASYRDTRYDGMLSDWYRRERGYGAGDMKIYSLLNGLAAGGYLMGVLEIIASVVLLIMAIVRM